MSRNAVIEDDLQTILSDQNIDWKALEGSTILISGANGFLPAYIVETLMFANETVFKNKTKIIGIVRSNNKAHARFPYFKNRNDIEFIEQDIAAPLQVSGDIDYIIHAASHASPRYFFSDPVGTIAANAMGTDNLLKIAKDKKSKSFLFFSSGEACGNIFDTKDVVTENDYGVLDPLAVRSCYGESKRMGESLCACYFHQYGVPAKVVRPAHTYGPGFSFDDGRAFASFVGSVIHNQNIVLKSDGKACRSFIYLADATRGYFTVLLKGQNGQAYNVGNEYEISMLELANTVIQASGNTKLKVEFDIPKSGNVSSSNMHGLLSIDKIKSLGWNPITREPEGFKRTIDYYRSIP